MNLTADEFIELEKRLCQVYGCHKVYFNPMPGHGYCILRARFEDPKVFYSWTSYSWNDIRHLLAADMSKLINRS